MVKRIIGRKSILLEEQPRRPASEISDETPGDVRFTGITATCPIGFTCTWYRMGASKGRECELRIGSRKPSPNYAWGDCPEILRLHRESDDGAGDAPDLGDVGTYPQDGELLRPDEERGDTGSRVWLSLPTEPGVREEPELATGDSASYGISYELISGISAVLPEEE